MAIKNSNDNGSEKQSDKNKVGKKLKLNRETIRNLRVLSADELKGVAGAAIDIESFDKAGAIC